MTAAKEIEKIILTWKIEDSSPAIIYKDGSISTYGSLNKEECRRLYKLGFASLSKYVGSAGYSQGGELLGYLEDKYPEWVEEFES